MQSGRKASRGSAKKRASAGRPACNRPRSRLPFGTARRGTRAFPCVREHALHPLRARQAAPRSPAAPSSEGADLGCRSRDPRSLRRSPILRRVPGRSLPPVRVGPCTDRPFQRARAACRQGRTSPSGLGTRQFLPATFPATSLGWLRRSDSLFCRPRLNSAHERNFEKISPVLRDLPERAFAGRLACSPCRRPHVSSHSLIQART